MALWPGEWTVMIAAFGHAPRTLEFTVPERAGDIDLRAELPLWGELSGRVILDDVPADLAVEYVTLVTDPFTGIHIVDDHTTEEMAGVFYVSRSRGLDFRLEQVATETPIRVWIRPADPGLGPPIMGENNVVVPSGGKAHVEIRAKTAGYARVRSERELAAGHLTFASGGLQFPPEREELLDRQQSLETVFTLPAGRARMRVTHTARLTGERRVADVECVVQAGKTIDVVLKFDR